MPAERAEQRTVERERALEVRDDEIDVVNPGGAHQGSPAPTDGALRTERSAGGESRGRRADRSGLRGVALAGRASGGRAARTRTSAACVAADPDPERRATRGSRARAASASPAPSSSVERHPLLLEAGGEPALCHRRPPAGRRTAGAHGPSASSMGEHQTDRDGRPRSVRGPARRRGRPRRRSRRARRRPHRRPPPSQADPPTRVTSSPRRDTPGRLDRATDVPGDDVSLRRPAQAAPRPRERAALPEGGARARRGRRGGRSCPAEPARPETCGCRPRGEG